ncbi:hypothetical protein OOK60_08705 [Trichothermofontia sichuanensis B231]|uniref:hypothetical protein n=1 Tax=Trichothermofontia sichuanensis TaxID=3045816 RepID=UPI00224775DE|nr:hypothetical protein [Trichothermofontia sichuanensis]UZQ56116.1 hypothetical protein OOK60_08705 [Trichothermofontia sichuanensis B231]
MKLSPFTHYYLRKLLSERLAQAETQTPLSAQVRDTNLNAVLDELYRSELSISIVVKELENLVTNHQWITTKHVHSQANTSAIEDRILQIFEPTPTAERSQLEATFEHPPDLEPAHSPPLQALKAKLNRQPLGAWLVEAGLLTPYQVKVALVDQQYEPRYRFGEVLLSRAWIKVTTLEFFLHLERAFTPEFHRLKLGQRLQVAGLVGETEIQAAIAQQQQQRQLRLGQILCRQGLIQPKTADFFAQF